jgi:regulatory protein YycH of two-component signal transduction system YycFG
MPYVLRSTIPIPDLMNRLSNQDVILTSSEGFIVCSKKKDVVEVAIHLKKTATLGEYIAFYRCPFQIFSQMVELTTGTTTFEKVERLFGFVDYASGWNTVYDPLFDANDSLQTTEELANLIGIDWWRYLPK